MGILQSLFKKKQTPPKTEQERFLETENQLREQFRHTWEEGIQRWCFTCKWFIYREEKPRNFVCRCPNELLKFGKTPIGCDECFGWGLTTKYLQRNSELKEAAT
jgi:hypothetical protein